MCPTVGMWPGRPMDVPNVVMFHDDIGAFISVFGRFPIMNRSNSLLLLSIKMTSILPYFKKNNAVGNQTFANLMCQVVWQSLVLHQVFW
jgi:hypothetical protein